MSKSISLGHDGSFRLPIEVVTLATAILAQRGAGKSHLASCMAEEMAEAHQQVVTIDPTGAWYGLKSSADGNKAGYPFVVFGGDHPDVPLEEHSGEIVARALVERGFSAIIDLSLFRKGQMRRFMAEFLETLYRLNRNPLHVFVDEADAIAPQRPGPDEARMLGAMEDMVRRGRRRGIGCTLITQRPQVLNKDVLTQCEVLVAMRLGHPRDIAAIKEWAGVHAPMDQLDEMVKSLPSLPTGTAWFWSPSLGVFERVKIRARRTFDSGATPRPGQTVRAPKAVAEIDLEKLGAEIAETVAKAKADDPRELKAKIRALEAEAVKPQPAVVDPSALDKAYQDGYRKGLQHGGEAMRVLAVNEAEFHLKAVKNLGPNLEPVTEIKRPIPAPPPLLRVVPPVRPRPQTGVEDGRPGKAERSILTALAQYPSGRTKSQMALLAGYAVNGGGFNNAISRCRSQGWLEGSGDSYRATPSGLSALGNYTPLPTGRDLAAYWLNQLGKAERSVLEVLLNHEGRAMTKEQVGQLAGYAPDGGGFNNALSRLRTLELIEGRGELRANQELF
jgi:hypothetical protein